MDNFELHHEAMRLADTHSPYMLAKMMLIEQKERIELAAHVERLMGALELARDRIALLAEIATEKGADVYAALEMWPKEMEETLAEHPETSLAHRDLIKQAEALEKLADESFAYSDQEINGIAADLRQQAKEISDD